MTWRVIRGRLVLGWDSDVGVRCRRAMDQRHADLRAGAHADESDAAVHRRRRQDEGRGIRSPARRAGRGTALSKTVDVKTLQFRRTNQEYSLACTRRLRANS